MFKLMMALFVPLSAFADTESDAILAQQGCFNVTYESRELATYEPGHTPRSRYFRTGATELVVVDRSSENEIILQHITAFEGVGENHWGQVWTRQPAFTLDYMGGLSWKKNPVSQPEMKWSQYVTQVDQSPRYDCAAPWKISGGVREWECLSWSPLPRREYGRKDYNVLERNNRHILTHTGWIHHQENRKLKVENGQATPVATELTVNTYDRIPMSECEPALQHWHKFGSSWRKVRDIWREIAEARGGIQFRSEVVGGQTMWMRLFEDVEAQAAAPADELTFGQKIKSSIADFIN